ncbi:hypothetical protein L249_5302 [Ophiocordyceps polyrhachis-furcata BCC 54312]|uniref:Sin3 associated polypeptide p18 n=1 Tax=Ophiocordyceps polyrhachis-furcata BCC 54312 TaxID=1330021 RepID=A0A367L8G4_9HYPO|nr:hypothetical protein L249_5302 [Ophiocordyceps polyrhachis-furcata BCC 54312]
MSPQSGDSHRRPPAPFLVHLMYRSGAFFRPEDFSSKPLPPHVSLYTWPSCTLSELAMELAALKPSALPHPAVGTRLVFQLVYPDLRSTAPFGDALPRYAVKDLGSIVIGHSGPGAETSELGATGGTSRNDHDIGRTLNHARFVVGDFVSCAILPPLSDGSVAPASNARSYGIRENGLGGGRGIRAGRREGGPGGTGGGVPKGEWRRGETLPDMSPRRGASRW